VSRQSTKYRAVLVDLASSFQIANTPENGGHDLAHALLLQKPQPAVEKYIDKMSDVAADQHEIETIALQLAAMRSLGIRCSAKESVDVSFSMKRSTVHKTPKAMERAVKKQAVNQRALRKFVALVKALAEVI
jgi:hypothetical protein